MQFWRLSKLCFLALLLSSTSAAYAQDALDCLPYRLSSDAGFPNPAKWGTTDSGPVLTGFVTLEGQNGRVLHGVDLSKHNAGVRYSELSRCGASFAIVKMDYTFPKHSVGLLANNIPVIPYHYLHVTAGGINYRKQASLFSGAGDKDLTREESERLINIARRSGREQAHEFLTIYEQAVPVSGRHNDLLGLTGEIIALDVEEVLKAPYTGRQARNYGRFYAASLAAWVNTVHESHPDAVIIFYTFADVYESFLQFGLPEDNAAIHGVPIWLAATGPESPKPSPARDLSLRTRSVQRLCLSSAGNRCVLHQYSHRALFGAAHPQPGQDPPPHHDVDRLFATEVVRDDVGIQYVRRSAPKSDETAAN